MPPTFDHSALPRYTQRPFPPYRYLPTSGGAAQPHPRVDPNGHSYDAEEDYLPQFSPANWPGCEIYLYGIDLFNHGYWWEAHEALETVWHAAGTRTPCGCCIQGLIQLAGAQLKRFVGEPDGALSLTRAGVVKLAPFAEESYLGIKIAKLIEDVQRCLNEDRGEYPVILLKTGDCS